jgi:hypothetical protein
VSGPSDLAAAPPAGASAPASGRRVVVLDTEAAVRAVAREWQALDPHPNADPEFFLTIAKSRPSILSPYVFAQMRGDVLEALLVARLEVIDYECRFGYRTVWKPKVRALSVVYGGWLRTSPDVPWTPLVAALTDALEKGVAVTAWFHRLEVGSELLAAVCAAAPARRRNESMAPLPHWRIALPATYDELLKRVSSSSRKQYRKQLRRLEEEFPGKVAIRRTTDESGVRDLCRRAESVAKATYQRGIGSGFVDGPENHERLGLAARRGRLRAFELEVEGQVRSYEICEKAGDTLYMDFTGYDAGFGKWDPGTVVIIEALQDALREGVKTIDWGFGDATYKRKFDAVMSEERDVYLFAPGPKGLVLNAVKGGVAWAARCAKSVVARVKLQDRLKKMMRKSAKKDAAAAAAPAESGGAAD